MSTEEIDRPFESIESAQEFMNVLAAVILDVMQELNAARTAASQDGEQRRERALELATYQLKMLARYVHKSRRALNDLRILRRLIMNERLTVENVIGMI
jgi:hypothetical protein